MHSPVRKWSTPKVWEVPTGYEPVEHDVADTSLTPYGRLQRIKDAFAVADGLNIRFVGETIIDEYRYVKALQKSSKEFVIATVETGKAEFAGGIVAASKHAEWPESDHITSWKTIRKTRFVDADFKRKLFEVYSVDRIVLRDEEREYFRRHLDEEVKKADVVIVIDFGHGLIGEIEREILSGAKFLAVNAQSNAGNYGFNPVTQYGKADFVCIDEPELRLATVMPDGSFSRAVELLKRHIDCHKFIITRGRNGLVGDDQNSSFELPAFAPGGIDTIGAGDAVLAVTAPLLAAGLSLEDAAFVGNVAGAIKVGIVGHERHVGRAELLAAVEGRLGH